MDDTLSQDLSNVLSAFENYRRNEPRASAQLVRMLEAMKMHVEGPSAYLGRMRYQVQSELQVSFGKQACLISEIAFA